MNIFFLNEVMQNEHTIEPQLINNTLYYWTVKSERLKIDETIKDWVKRKIEYLNNRKDNFDAIGIYDVSAHGIYSPSPNQKNKAGMIIRYAVLKNGI